MLVDLNVPWPVRNYTTRPSEDQMTNLKNTIATLHTMGYTHIAINFHLRENVKMPKKTEEVNPIDMDGLRDHFAGAKFPRLRLFSRLTMVVSEPAQCQGLSRVQSLFDVVAMEPLTERALQLAVTNLDLDLISFNMSSRLPFFLKHKTIGAAFDKGIKFEMCYSPMIAGPAGYSIQSANENMSLTTSALLARKLFLSNCLLLIRASRSRGLVISSGATQPLQARNLADILRFLNTIGLDVSRAKSCVTVNPERVLVSGRLKIKSYKQTIVVGTNNEEKDVLYSNTGEVHSNNKSLSPYVRDLEDTGSRLTKKQRMK